jgi:multicomponent Na+:H+ antiporter subunit E
MTIFIAIAFFFWFIIIGGISPILHNPMLHICSIIFGIAAISKYGFMPQKIGIRLRYFLWLVREIFNSAINVTKYIYSSEKYTFKPEVRWIESRQKNEADLVLYANSITLTPGTITIDLEGRKLLVHALDSSGIKDLQKGEMDMNISLSK